MTPADFFAQQSPASALKSEIVVKYLVAWVRVVSLGTGRHVVYFDPFCGPGRYRDGSLSTPLLVIEAVSRDTNLNAKLLTVFRDADESYCKALRENIAAFPETRNLHHPPVVFCEEVNETLAKHFAETPLSPTFAFLDPMGFKGVTLDLVDSLIRNWGCDCLFFFNYNEVNRWLKAPGVAPHIDALFRSARAEALRSAVLGLRSGAREKLVLDTLKEGILDGPAEYVQTFRFMNQTGSRTSHYLVFATKVFKGYEIMRDVMARASSYSQGGVPTYVYTPKPPEASLFDSLVFEDFKDDLVGHFAGKTLTVRNAFEKHSVGKRFVLPNYKRALLDLERAGRIEANPPADNRPKNTMGDDVAVRFPR